MRKQTEKNKKEVFGPDLLSHLWRVLFLIAGWTAAVYLFWYEMPWGTTPEQGTDGIEILIVLILGLAVAPVIYLQGLNVITITDTTLTVSWWNVKKKHFRLEDIAWVHVTGILPEIRIYPFNQDIGYKYGYRLDKTDHWAFFGILKKRDIEAKCDSGHYEITVKFKKL